MNNRRNQPPVRPARRWGLALGMTAGAVAAAAMIAAADAHADDSADVLGQAGGDLTQATQLLDGAPEASLDAEQASFLAGQESLQTDSGAAILSGQESLQSGLPAADQADLTGADDAVSWKQAMRAYAGKTGAPYARDAAMTALMAGLPDEQVRAWRSFGCLFGVMRQLANDRAGDGADNADLTNGTPTLLLGHAFGHLPGHGRDQLARLRMDAASDLAQRQRLHELLASADLTVGYNGRIDAISGRVAALLSRLAAASRYRDLLLWMIRASADRAKLASPDQRTAESATTGTES